MGVVCPELSAPRYPPEAAKHYLEGEVVARARIGEGKVKEVLIISGPQVFHAAVTNAMKRYKCNVDGGEVVAEQTFEFKLDPGVHPSPDWTVVGPTPNGLGFADKSSVRRADGHARMWVLLAGERPIVTLGKVHQSLKLEIEYDCVNPRQKSLVTVFYEMPDGSGPLSMPIPVAGPWSTVTPNSPGELYWTLACRAPLPETVPVDSGYAIDLIAATRSASGARDAVQRAVIPLDRRYSDLTAEHRRFVRSQYEAMDENDEPPFPVDGMKSIHESIYAAQRATLVKGMLALDVLVNSDGEATSVEVRRSPDPAMTRLAAAIVMRQKYKAAVCAGKPCEMALPLRFDLRAN